MVITASKPGASNIHNAGCVPKIRRVRSNLPLGARGSIPSRAILRDPSRTETAVDGWAATSAAPAEVRRPRSTCPNARTQDCVETPEVKVRAGAARHRARSDPMARAELRLSDLDLTCNGQRTTLTECLSLDRVETPSPPVRRAAATRKTIAVHSCAMFSRKRPHLMIGG